MLSERDNLNISMVVKGKNFLISLMGYFLLFMCRNLVKRTAEGQIKYKKGHLMYFKVQKRTLVSDGVLLITCQEKKYRYDP